MSGKVHKEQCTGCDDLWEPDFFCEECSKPYEEFHDDWVLDPMKAELDPTGDFYGAGYETVYPNICLNCCYCHLKGYKPPVKPVNVPPDTDIPF